MKIVINNCFGGFGLSRKALDFMNIPYTIDNSYGRELLSYNGPERTDKKLIEAIETLGSKVCSGQYAELKIVEIPDNLKFWNIVFWNIEEYDGAETIIASETMIYNFA